ncbi:MAG: DUF5677 domain-containing protein [Faecalibacterium sp.]
MENEMEPHVEEALNQFAELINLCRDELSKLTLLEGRTYEYALIRVYSKVLLTCCEIYTLLRAGYPEGAFALSRSMYEALVITSTLLEGRKNSDELLIDKFFDASIISTLNIYLDRAEWEVKHDPQNAIAPKAKEELSHMLQKFKDKYDHKNFRDAYWWANASNLGELAQRSGFSKSPMYSRISGNIHFNTYDVFTYINNEEPCVLIGETFKGIELPLWYTALCLHCICGLLHGSYPNFVSENTYKQTQVCADQFFSLHRNGINNRISKHNVYLHNDLNTST